ncbi:hypothetical protein AB0K15_40420 [Amycolatopsis sp. NPDC049253]|uniref:hypothetical protein n=1 Tax=Amycolatopsis sp. NPDC049253 TaxID=3155274 RepID=UPI00342A9E51
MRRGAPPGPEIRALARELAVFPAAAGHGPAIEADGTRDATAGARISEGKGVDGAR